ncbi:MAG: hypothetical protein JRE21_08960 [Deltaproteobacteria bacterium]|jgi:RNAse (barnase) inhibitor barstar|nr:hypothetical protein [Deltaproteobacteria bacterium]
MADFNINLAKTMVNSPEERQRFYHRMLIYLAICAAALVYVAYLASMNLVAVIHSNRERQALIKTNSSVLEHGQAFYRNPERTYRELEAYGKDLETLRDLLITRAQFLPVFSQLFLDFPDDIALQDLTATASSRTIEFGLVAPYLNDEGESPIGKLQARWKANKELITRTTGIRQVTSERRLVGDKAAVFVTFECVLR